MTTESELLPEVYREPAPVTVFGTDDPREIVARSKGIAQALGEAIREGGMVSKISGRDYVRVEGWAYLGAMIGVFPHTTSTRELRTEDGDLVGFEATVELVTKAGEVVGGASAICTRDEQNWSGRDHFALMSMAQTRAVGKAYRMPFGFIMASAGYEATPAEEMPGDLAGAPRAAPVGSTHAQGTVNTASAFWKRAKDAYGMAPDQVCAMLGITTETIAASSAAQLADAAAELGAKVAAVEGALDASATGEN